MTGAGVATGAAEVNGVVSVGGVAAASTGASVITNDGATVCTDADGGDSEAGIWLEAGAVRGAAVLGEAVDVFSWIGVENRDGGIITL